MTKWSVINNWQYLSNATNIHTRLTALCPRLPGWAGTRKVKPIWISVKQETVSSSGISWTICKYAPRSRQITRPAHHRSVSYRPDALPAAQPTASMHWRQLKCYKIKTKLKRKTNSQSYVAKRLAPLPMTFSDLEGDFRSVKQWNFLTSMQI